MLCFPLSPAICVLETFLARISLLPERLHGWKQSGSSFPHSQSHMERMILVAGPGHVPSSGLSVLPAVGAVPEPEAASAAPCELSARKTCRKNVPERLL